MIELQKKKLWFFDFRILLLLLLLYNSLLEIAIVLLCLVAITIYYQQICHLLS